jgi:sirohydrochlorin ferrochelatase
LRVRAVSSRFGGPPYPDVTFAATVKRLEETVNLVREAATKNAMYCNELERRVAKLEAVIAEAQSLLNESPKAATTPAKVRVVLPEIPGWATDDRVTAGWNSCIVQVKLALSAAGVEVKEASK